MPTGSISQVTSVAGLSIQSTINRTGTGQISHEVDLPAAKAGTLSARVDNDTGTVTAAGHGLVGGEKVNVFWAGGCRYGMTAGVPVGNDVGVDLGAGDNLPAAATNVTIAKQIVIETDFAGDTTELVVATADKTAHMDIRSAGASVAAKLFAANEPWYWAKNSGVANPLAGAAIDKIAVSNGDATAAGKFRIGVLYDSAT